MISSCQGDLKDLLEKYNAGFYYEPDDQVGLEAQIKKYLELSESEIAQMKSGADKLFGERLDAANIYKDFVDHIIEDRREYSSQKREMRKDGNVSQL